MGAIRAEQYIYTWPQEVEIAIMIDGMLYSAEVGSSFIRCVNASICAAIDSQYRVI